jgi:hypothetical protein
MSLSRIGCALVLVAALAFASAAQAQDCDFSTIDYEFEFEGLIVQLPNGVPTPGRDICIGVNVDVDVEGEGTIFFRPTGSTGEYMSERVQEIDGAYRVEIDGSFVTIRGLDVYGVGTLADTGETYTFPEDDPAENPIRVPVFIGRYEAPVALPASEYAMITVGANVSPATIEDVLDDDFGRPEDARWRVARWAPTLGRYEQLSELDRPIEPGEAFWFIAADGGTFDIDIAESTNPDSLAPIVLPPGFNQIGTPYAFRVAWDDVLAASGLNASQVSLPMEHVGGSDYRPVNVLEPWRGYFVENLTGGPLTLTVPALEALGGGAVRAPEASYAVRVEARSGDYADLNNIVGFASPEQDRLALREPPPVGGHLRVSVVEADERWMWSLQPERTDGAFWDLEVAATEDLLGDGPRRVTLSLDELGTRPAAFGLYVIDRDRGTALVHTNGTVEVELSREAPVRRLRLIAGTEAFARTGSEGAPLQPTTFALDPGYPNPFAAQTTIGYRLDARGPATLEVFDLLGRRVRVLMDGEQLAGPHTATWDGRDGAGRPVASGVYLVRLRTGDASATRRVSVLR